MDNTTWVVQAGLLSKQYIAKEILGLSDQQMADSIISIREDKEVYGTPILSMVKPKFKSLAEGKSGQFLRADGVWCDPLQCKDLGVKINETAKILDEIKHDSKKYLARIAYERAMSIVDGRPEV